MLLTLRFYVEALYLQREPVNWFGIDLLSRLPVREQMLFPLHPSCPSVKKNLVTCDKFKIKKSNTALILFSELRMLWKLFKKKISLEHFPAWKSLETSVYSKGY